MPDRAKAKIREREVERSLKKLSSKDPDERREAVVYLGEAAASDSVNEIIDVYETDDDKRVRKAAAYALGQFKAIDRALSRGKQSEVERLLKRVEVEGKLGKRAAVGPTFQVILILLVLLGLLVAANVFSPLLRERLREAVEVVEARTAPRRDRETLLTDAQTYLSALQADAEALRAEFTTLLGGGTLGCDASFTAPDNYLIAPEDAAANADISELVTQLNDAGDRLRESRAVYDQACRGETTVATENAGAMLLPVREASDLLTTAQTGLAVLTGAPSTTATPAQTGTTQADPRSFIPPLTTIIDQMIGENGATAQLVRFWSEAGTSGGSSGCGVERPAIPENFVLPGNADVDWPTLAQAVVQINTGLEATRNGWNQLAASCNENTLGGQARAGVINAEAAQNALIFARDLLALVESGTF